MLRDNGRAMEQRDSAPPSDLCKYAKQMIEERLHKMLGQVDDVRRSEETEPVHKMRVASRRARAALDIFDVCFADSDYARDERQVKKVTHVLSEARDVDVMREKLADHLRELPQEQRSGLQSYIDQLQRRREQAQKTVDKALRRLESYDLEAHIKALSTKGDFNRARQAAGRRRGEHG